MTTTNAERLRTYKLKMKAAGFKRLSVYVSAELVALIDKNRKRSECRGRTLERLLLGEAAKRPAYPWTAEERARREFRLRKRLWHAKIA